MSLRALASVTALAGLIVLAGCAPSAAPTSTAVSTAVSTATLHSAEVSEASREPVETEILPSPTAEPALAARVNGRALYLANYEHALEQYKYDLVARGVDPDSGEGKSEMADARTWILNVMIEQILMEQAAAQSGIMVSDEEVDTYLQNVVDENGSDEAFRAKLEQRGETYDHAREEVRLGLLGMRMTQRVIDQVPTTAEHVHVRHILVDTEEEADHLLNQLQAGADFASLAQAYSQDVSTRDSGGDLGTFPRGILVAPEVEDVGFALQPGQFSGVISSTLGYHIVQVIERYPAREISPENLRLLRERAVQEWVDSLWASASIERYVQAEP